MAAPYRADHVGSLLRPPELVQARTDFGLKKITAEQLREVEDKSILKAIELQRETGIGIFTEGEYRRSGWSGAIRDRPEENHGRAAPRSRRQVDPQGDRAPARDRDRDLHGRRVPAVGLERRYPRSA